MDNLSAADYYKVESFASEEGLVRKKKGRYALANATPDPRFVGIVPSDSLPDSAGCFIGRSTFVHG